MERLQDPWVFATVSAGLVGVVTFAVAQVTNKHDGPAQGVRAFIVAILSLLLLTWIAHHDPAVMTEPFPMS